MRSPHHLRRRYVLDVAVAVATVGLLTAATVPRADDDARRGRPPPAIEGEVPAPAPDVPDPEDTPPDEPPGADGTTDGDEPVVEPDLPVVEPDVPVDADDTPATAAGGRGLAATAVGALLVAVATIAGVGGWALGRRTRNRAAAAVAGEDTTVTAAGRSPAVVRGPDATDTAVADLVDGLIAVHDLATDDGQRTRVRETLRRVAVVPIEPAPRTTFDPTRHRALGTELGGGPDDEGRIARTERPGWIRGDQLLRPPEVTVYRARHEVAPT